MLKILFQVFSNNGSHWFTFNVTGVYIYNNPYNPLNLLNVPYTIFDHLEEKHKNEEK